MKDKMINKVDPYIKGKEGYTKTKCYELDVNNCWKEIYQSPYEDCKIDSLHEGEHVIIYRNMFKIICKAYDEEYNCIQLFLEKEEIKWSRRLLYYKDEE